MISSSILLNYPGLHDLFREGDPTAGTNPQPVDFYSPDTFNFTVLNVSLSGKTLTIKSVGMNSTAQNAGIESVNGPQARTIFSFEIDGFASLRGSTEAIRNELNDAIVGATNNKDIDRLTDAIRKLDDASNSIVHHRFQTLRYRIGSTSSCRSLATSLKLPSRKQMRRVSLKARSTKL